VVESGWMNAPQTDGSRLLKRWLHTPIRDFKRNSITPNKWLQELQIKQATKRLKRHWKKIGDLET